MRAVGRRALRPRAAGLRRGRPRARRSTVDVVGAGATRRRRGSAARRRRAAPRSAPEHRRSTRSSPSSSSSSATPTASPTPPRSPSPSCPARPTTRSSSTARPASARPTSCTRSATTSARYGAGLTVRYTTVEAFTNAVPRRAAAAATSTRFKGRFRHTDVLLIDDVQFLESKAKTEEEFFHTFNALHDTGSQLVLTSDRLPRDLAALEDRLRERFEAGLVTDIQPPDLATRMTVLRKRAQPRRRRRSPTTASCELIADAHPDNIRALEGALIRVVAFASLTGRPLDAAARRRGPRRPLSRAPRRPARAGAAHRRAHPGRHLRRLRPHARRAALRQPRRPPRLAAPGRHVPRARAHRTRPSPPSARASAGATTRPSCTPAGAPPQRIAADPEAFDVVRRLDRTRSSVGPVADRRHD